MKYSNNLVLHFVGRDFFFGAFSRVSLVVSLVHGLYCYRCGVFVPQPPHVCIAYPCTSASYRFTHGRSMALQNLICSWTLSFFLFVVWAYICPILKQLRNLLLLLFVLLSGHAKASHLAGGYITYEYLGNDKYLVKFHFIRDCSGISFNNPTFGIGFSTVNNSSFNMANLAITTVKRTSISKIQTVCDSLMSSQCNPPNTSNGKGYEIHIYEDTIDFGKAPYKKFYDSSTVSRITFYGGQCCRSGAITTGPHCSDFYVKS